MQIHEMSSMPVLLALMLLGYTGVLAMEILRRWRTRWEKCVHRIYLLGLVLDLSAYLAVTFFLRSPEPSARFRMAPFYSLLHLLDENGLHLKILREMVLNVILFVPLGVLLGEMFRKTEHPFGYVVLAGLGMTVLTEVFQYILRLGLAEMDDVIHNMAGLLIGWAAYSAAQSAAEALTK